MKVISFSIFKGGTGKTTSAVNTAAALVQRSKKVLLIDLDQQASATRYLDLDPDQSPTLFDVFTGTKSAASAIKQSKSGIHTLTSNTYLAAFENSMDAGDETRLSDLITPLKPDYDFILIDTPPGKAALAFSGLVAADLILIPASADRMSVDGVADLLNHVQKIMWSKYPLPYQELRILFTMFRATTTHSPAVMENAKKIWRENVLTITVPHSTAFARSYDQKMPLPLLEPKHPGSLAYGVLADWLIAYETDTH